MLRIDPVDPIERMEPADPIERMEPADPMDRIDPKENNDPIDTAENSLCGERQEVLLRCRDAGEVPSVTSGD